ncbi:peroxiredoxin [Flavobacterium croceum DSM 17960]|uniref:Peroxiredoxin n=2 Tax=Flavobacterium TaxID=237 RepID=A0A2S4N7J9_9FLAO|nr:peroxiredoxin [Flavobacterium croceum DSM 17960]
MKFRTIMVKYCFLFLLFSTLTFSQTPKVNVEYIQSSYAIWKNYHFNNILLSLDFKALDVNNTEISKENFLNELTTGKYLPVEIESEKGFTYKLFVINSKADTSIKATIEAQSFDILQNLKREILPFPDFSFKDIDGNTIDFAQLKGKIIVLKCWFIHCASCIKEFPSVNNLAEKYKSRNDIVFISLAEDSAEALKIFLQKKPLQYLVVPNMKDYMYTTMGVGAFPTHYILDKEGKIYKILSNEKELEIALDKIAHLE